ncbi:major capsid protein [Streptococcus phage Javan173]|uniref:major capsid protein n=1 Tax=Streptococcus entericus TaxID=155680 RepID=UPI00036ED3BA|nr:major capsid protein [Streptococcus entericus]QBX15145.1 major capsid protein [Streptococcus phage Javan173]
MALIYDTVTAANLAGYYNAAKQNVDTTFGEKAFPVTKQLGLKLAFVKGAAGKPVVLRASAFDTKVTIRDRISVTLTEEEMPFFKESLLVKEKERQQLNILQQTNNTALIDTVLQTIFDDQTSLVSGAKARLEAMRMQVLATGKISVVSNGQSLDYDYGVEESHKGTVKTAWSAAKATPLADIEAATNALSALGGKAEVLIMNGKTFALAKNAASTVTIIKPLAPAGSSVTKREFTDYLKDEHGLSIQVVDDTYRDEDGTIKKYFPDGTVTFAPNAALGRTVFGTTPEESDLMSGVNNAEVSIVETGIAITTTKETDPVNVQTKVSMIALPSFEQLDNVYMLDIEP